MPYQDYQKQLEANRRSYERNKAKRVQIKRDFRSNNLLLTRAQKRESSRRIKAGIRRDPKAAAEAYKFYTLMQRRLDEAKRKGIIRLVKGTCSAQHLQARIAFYGGQCWICGEEAKTIDHVIPLSKGGTNWPANLRPACRSCNSKKGNKDWRLFTHRNRQTPRHKRCGKVKSQYRTEGIINASST